MKRLNLKKKTGGQRGFTLLELVIAVGLMAALLVSIYSVLFPVLRSRERIESALEQTRQVRRFMDAFSRETRSAFFKEGGKNTVFLGEARRSTLGKPASRITFTTFTYPASISKGDMALVSYFILETDQKKLTLYKEVRNPFSTATEKENGFKVEVVSDVEGFEVSFYNGKEWSKAWDASLENSPPVAVKVELAIKDKGEVREFSSIARIRVI